MTLADFSSGHVDETIKARIIETLRIKKADLEPWYRPGIPMIRLEGTPLGLRFKDFFTKIAQGNQGRSELVELEFNVETFTFTGKVKVIHEHSWGKLADILAQF